MPCSSVRLQPNKDAPDIRDVAPSEREELPFFLGGGIVPLREYTAAKQSFRMSSDAEVSKL